MPQYKPVVLVVLDGWGQTTEEKGNPLKKAKLPTIKLLDRFYPKILLQASGLSVGLSWGESGNSEVGHQALGSGQIIYQSLPRITMAIENGEFFQNPVLIRAIEEAKKRGGTLHLMGLLSDGSVHSHISHLFALLEMAKEHSLKKVFIHAITDGRDTPPNSGIEYVAQLQNQFKTLGIGQLASLCGRFYTMDRNENWDRVEKGFKLMVEGQGEKENDPIKAIKKQYANKIYDEYLPPILINEEGLIKENDVVIFFNFREDRAREITKAFVSSDFDKFDIAYRPKNLFFVSMIEYEKDLPVSAVAFLPQAVKTTIGKILSENNRQQLRIAESEKYAHVTYFFNGGVEKAYPKEKHILIPSKNLPSYDALPEMSALEITEKLEAEIENDQNDFILVNYANADMVGHSGNFQACIKAVETVDACLVKIIKATLKKGGCLLITADHGNVEQLINLKTLQRNTEHSANPVPLWLVTAENHSERTPLELFETQGLLCDVAPTVLELMNLPKDKDMLCESLLPLLK